MVKKLLSISLLAFSLYGANLSVANGKIEAHTEVFGDSAINPTSTNVKANLSFDGTIESLRGVVSIDTKSLISTNTERDTHMYETLEADKYNSISFDIKAIQKDGVDYNIIGELKLCSVTKPIKAKATITKLSDSKLNINSIFAINMSDFGVKPPKLLFLTVRDRVDLNVSLDLK